jgi:hypothetical protein
MSHLSIQGAENADRDNGKYGQRHQHLDHAEAAAVIELSGT